MPAVENLPSDPFTDLSFRRGALFTSTFSSSIPSSSPINKVGLRVDGRDLLQRRPLRIKYFRDLSTGSGSNISTHATTGITSLATSSGETVGKISKASAEVHFGKTKVLGVVSAEIVSPYPDRPTEGMVSFTADYSSMAGLHVEQSRSWQPLLEVNNIVERTIKESHALDTEALCIIAGSKVWSIQVNITVLDDDGNVVDAASSDKHNWFNTNNTKRGNATKSANY